MGLLPRWAWLWSPGTDSQHPMYQEFHAKRTTGKLEETLREKLENMKNNAQKLKAQKQMTQKLSQKSQGPKQVDAKVEKNGVKREHSFWPCNFCSNFAGVLEFLQQLGARNLCAQPSLLLPFNFCVNFSLTLELVCRST